MHRCDLHQAHAAIGLLRLGVKVDDLQESSGRGHLADLCRINAKLNPRCGRTAERGMRRRVVHAHELTIGRGHSTSEILSHHVPIPIVPKALIRLCSLEC